VGEGDSKGKVEANSKKGLVIASIERGFCAQGEACLSGRQANFCMKLKLRMGDCFTPIHLPSLVFAMTLWAAGRLALLPMT
jgi:hypothetical protein